MTLFIECDIVLAVVIFMEKIDNIMYDEFNNYYQQFLTIIKHKSSSSNKIDGLIIILQYINDNYEKFDKDELRDIRNICLISKHLLIKIDSYKTLKLPEKDSCKTLLANINKKIKSSN